jgi:DNA-binding NtrC family response regulator
MVQRFGHRPVTAAGGDEAVALLTGSDARPIDCVILDMVMPDLDGLGVLARMRDAGLAIPVIVQTAHGGLDNVVSAMRAGATDFVVKPASAERLQVSLRNALAGKALAGELQRIKRSRDGTLTFSDVITRAPRMKATLAGATKAAGSDIPVLVEGESGVGKELIARAIHGTGARRAKPSVALNCVALPENLVESILFGHEKGAFTGATERHIGKFVEADGGTLFLDEIGELPLAAQVKLLRALQEGEVEPVGARRPVKVDVRIVSATNRDLIADVKAGRFREDLFYRLHVFPIAVPPLRERPEDIPELARHFAARFSAEEGKRISAISTDALALLAQYRWPGNVRQIENAVFRAVVLADGETIGVNEFPHIAAQLGDDRGVPMMGATAQSLTALVPGDALPVEPPALTFPTSTLKLTGADGHVRPLDEIERDVIRYAISHYRGQMSEVARRLKFGRSTLYRKLEGLGLRDDAHEDAGSGDERWAD